MSIPRVFHFVFGLKQQDTPFHLLHYLCLASCLQTQQPEAVVVHCLYEPYGPLWQIIKPQIVLHFLCLDDLDRIQIPHHAAFEQYRYAHLSDFVRLSVLQQRGGVYADMDTLFLAPYPDWLYEQKCVLGRELLDHTAAGAQSGGSLCNAVILAQPGSTFLDRWAERMLTAFDGTWSHHSTFLPYELSTQFPQEVHVEPESSFFFIPWTARGIASLFTRYQALPTNVYSLHLWSHLWWSRHRTDFSSFHAERITAEYIHHAHTTYACHARPFLPIFEDSPSRVRWQWQRAKRLGDVGFAFTQRISSLRNRKLSGKLTSGPMHSETSEAGPLPRTQQHNAQ